MEARILVDVVPRVNICYYSRVSSAQGGVIGAGFHLPCQDILRVVYANQPPETNRNLYARMVQKRNSRINSGLMSERLVVDEVRCCPAHA